MAGIFQSIYQSAFSLPFSSKLLTFRLFFFSLKTFIFIHKMTIHHDTMLHTLVDILHPIRPVKPGRRQYLHRQKQRPTSPTARATRQHIGLVSPTPGPKSKGGATSINSIVTTYFNTCNSALTSNPSYLRKRHNITPTPCHRASLASMQQYYPTMPYLSSTPCHLLTITSTALCTTAVYFSTET